MNNIAAKPEIYRQLREIPELLFAEFMLNKKIEYEEEATKRDLIIDLAINVIQLIIMRSQVDFDNTDQSSDEHITDDEEHEPLSMANSSQNRVFDDTCTRLLTCYSSICQYL